VKSLQVVPVAHRPQVAPHPSGPQALPWQSAAHTRHAFSRSEQVPATACPQQPVTAHQVAPHAFATHASRAEDAAAPCGDAPAWHAATHAASAQRWVQSTTAAHDWYASHLPVTQAWSAAQVPQAPPQPSGPQALPAHAGVQPPSQVPSVHVVPAAHAFPASQPSPRAEQVTGVFPMHAAAPTAQTRAWQIAESQ
jgi:hypothetical protein